MDRNSSKFRFIENTYGSELFPKTCELSFVRVVHGACSIMVNNERLINSEVIFLRLLASWKKNTTTNCCV
ncbi:unnamed protein product [Rhizophagus irregularis]|nr:unnamed protein product [Rhizophagus irregularis]